MTDKLRWNDSDNKASCGSVPLLKLFPHISISISEVMVLPDEINYEKTIHAWYKKLSLKKQIGYHIMTGIRTDKDKELNTDRVNVFPCVLPALTVLLLLLLHLSPLISFTVLCE